MKISHRYQYLAGVFMRGLIISFMFIVILGGVFGAVKASDAQNLNPSEVIMSLNLENVELIQAIKEIEKETEFKFAFNYDTINLQKIVSIKAYEQSVEEILEQLFEDTRLTWGSTGRVILLRAYEDPVGELQNYNFNFQELTGRVTDSETGEGLPGVNVVIVGSEEIIGSTIGTITNINGYYEIEVPEELNILVFSYVGYLTREVEINDRSEINIQLQPDIEMLDDIVVIGYGVQDRQQVTGAVSSVTSAEFVTGDVNDPARLIQGKIPGLSIVAPQGNPNAEYTIRLRGLATLGASTEPLIVIDGVLGGDLNSIDPSDIERVDVLKGAGASAIYGSRAAGGVIQVSSKSGNVGRTQLGYQVYTTAESIDRSLSVMGKEEYLSMGGTDLGSSTNWMDEITRTAISQVHNISLSGGVANTTFRASLNYRNVDGVLNNSGFERLNGRLNILHKALDDKLSVNMILATTSSESDLAFNQAFQYAITMPPTAPIRASDSYFEKYDGYFQSEVHDLYNPAALIEQNKNVRANSRKLYNMEMRYDIFENLTASLRLTEDNNEGTNSSYISKYSYYGDGLNRNGLASGGNSKSKNELLESMINYTKWLQDLNLDLMGGYSYQSHSFESLSVTAGNFLTDAFENHNIGAAGDFASGEASASSFKENYKIIAFFGRMNLNYKHTYFLSGSYRREGSTRFGAGNKWGDFFGISAGADIANLIDITDINQLKLRSSYGVTGALPGESYLSQLRFGPGAGYVLNDGAWTRPYTPISNPNPNLKWETKSEFDIGIDFSLFNDRLSGSLDYYKSVTKDALVTLDVPVPPNLYNSSLLNAGELENKGIEAMLEFQAMNQNKFNWAVRLTYSTYNTNLNSLSIGNLEYGIRDIGGLPAPLAGNIVRVREGRPLGQLIGWQYDGIDENGQYIIKDINGDGQIDVNDYTIIGNGQPKGEIGLTNNFRLGNFDASFFIRGVYGHDLVNLNRTIFEQISRISSYNLVNTQYFSADYQGRAAYNSYYVEDASFIKLDNFTIGYNFNFSDNTILSSARVYVSGKNLFYITDYSGVDPEPRYSYQENVLIPGVEPLDSWVTTRSFTLGLNLSF
ncbi:MAG: SusC/RagA family TonB-linked outer membrane protein [Bacteroidales bacterium]